MLALPLNQFHFRPVRELGVGGLGRVDEIEVTASNASRKPVGSRWARKRLNAKWGAHPEIRQRFEREIAALGKMAHKNIVTLEGENLPGEERFYVMPVYQKSLRTLIAENSKRGDWRFVADQGAILADALGYAHRMNFIHRDLKPDNLLFNANGPLTITDWGLGGFVHKHSVVLQQLTRGGMGTEYYCSYEQWHTANCDQRGDIYSLGMTLDELLTGKQRVITPGHGIGAPGSGVGSTGEARLRAFLAKMTAFMPFQRPNNMAEVAAELRAIRAL